MTTLKRFKNRTQAGELLAQKLVAYAHHPDAIVVALPRGGVPVGFVIATALEVPLDILLVRKLGIPGYEEHAMGAIASGGLCVLQPMVLDRLKIPPSTIEQVAHRELDEIKRREKLYRAGRPALPLHNRVVILVDDGLATGSTMTVAVQAVRNQNPARVIIAVPIAAQEACKDLGAKADEIICLDTPSPFYAVGLWYDDFSQTSDHEVKSLLEEAERQQAPRSPDADSALHRQGRNNHHGSGIRSK
jgi:putative phosphoribosyl transferase